MELKTVKTRAAEVPYLEAGTGAPLVYLHGAGGVMPEAVLAGLAATHRVIAPYLPGYGETEDCPDLRDMLDFTLHTWDVVQALGIEKPLIVGESMGGMIAAEMAALAPNDLAGLVLIAPAGLWLDDHPIPDMFTLMPYELPAFLFHDVAAGTSLMTAGLNMSDPDFLKGYLVRNARQLGMAGKLMFPIPERGLIGRLYRIKVPTTIIWGESDRLIPPVYAPAFTGAIAGAKLVMVPQAGHMVTLEQPAAVVGAIVGAG